MWRQRSRAQSLHQDSVLTAHCTTASGRRDREEKKRRDEKKFQAEQGVIHWLIHHWVRGPTAAITFSNKHTNKIPPQAREKNTVAEIGLVRCHKGHCWRLLTLQASTGPLGRKPPRGSEGNCFSNNIFQLWIFPFVGATIQEETTMSVERDDCPSLGMSRRGDSFLSTARVRNSWIMKTKHGQGGRHWRWRPAAPLQTCFQRRISSSEISFLAHQLV